MFFLCPLAECSYNISFPFSFVKSFFNFFSYFLSFFVQCFKKVPYIHDFLNLGLFNFLLLLSVFVIFCCLASLFGLFCHAEVYVYSFLQVLFHTHYSYEVHNTSLPLLPLADIVYIPTIEIFLNLFEYIYTI